MKLIDTHNHLYLEEFDPQQKELILIAKESGIEKILLPNVDLTTIERMHQLCDSWPDFAYPMMGLHPTSIDKKYVTTLNRIESYLYHRKYCAIGEVGLDLYWDKTFLKEQIKAFEVQLQWCIDMSLPVVIHNRDAFPYTLESIYKVGADKLKGVFHSFTGTSEELEEIEKLPNFKIGINGVITFKNSNLREVITKTQMHKILLETDAPYLAPVPYRGRRNEPHYIWKTAEKVAECFSVSLEKVVEITRNNALELFKGCNKLI